MPLVTDYNGGQALTRNVLDNLANIFDEKQLKELVQKGVLGENVLSSDFGKTRIPIKPKLDRVANPLRRDAWFTAVRDRCRYFLEAFNYRFF